MEEIDMYLEDANDMMNKSIQHLSEALSKIRAGKASPAMLGGIMVPYYGNLTPLTQVASISSPDARTLLVKPWEKPMIQEIERAIMNGDLGLNPQSDGEQVIINIPALTEERRIQLVKQAKAEGVTVYDVDQKLFAEKVQSMYEAIEDEAIKTLVSRIRKVSP